MTEITLKFEQSQIASERKHLPRAVVTCARLGAWLPGFVLKEGLPGAQEAVTRSVVKGRLTWVQGWPRLPDL
jgi:hypothetical protein